MTEMNDPTAEVLARAQDIKAAVRPVYMEAAKLDASHPHTYAAVCVLAAKKFFEAAGYNREQQVRMVQDLADAITLAPGEDGATTFLG